jgi:23S rRNA (cytosine1962-C5)-methyltransferase
VGLFPEQSENWRWIEARVADAGRPLKVLNLFAYTGGSTLAAAVAGAEVVHVDGSNSVVSWARRNAELTGLTDAPIRWIVEDVRKFVQREIRRGSTYDALILDPPSYGHGPKGESWKLEQDLEPLLSDCARLTANRLAFVLVTCHTSGVGPTALRAQMRRAFSGVGRTDVFAGLLRLAMADGRCLPSGIVARWP